MPTRGPRSEVVVATMNSSSRSSRHLVHLVRRALGSMSNAPITDAERAVARDVLGSAEFEVWSKMDGRDQRHSLQVLARFDDMVPGAPRTWRAAALLHDVGKISSRLGWSMRILATVVGPRGERFRRYYDHERLGGEMLRLVSDAETVALVAGESDDEKATRALRAADDL